MDASTLAIAIVGAATGLLSLGWQVATYVLEGGRVKVTLLERNLVDDSHKRGYLVTVANRGRLPVQYRGHNLQTDVVPLIRRHGRVGLVFLKQLPTDPKPGQTIEPGHSVEIFIDKDDLLASQWTPPRPFKMQAAVVLGSGRYRRSRWRNRLTVKEE